MSSPRIAIGTAVLLAAASTALAQPPARPAAPAGMAPPRADAPKRPGLLFREEWRNPTGVEVPLSAANSMRNPDLEVHIYGPAAMLKGTGHEGDEGDPPHIFSGECKSACAFTLRSKKSAINLTGLARIRVSTKMSGFHKVYPIVKLASGDWYIADRPQGSSLRDYIVSEFNTSDLRWTKLDIDNVFTKGNPVDKVDLSKVEEVGFADLIPASGHGPGGWFDVAGVEVYASPAPR